MGVNFNNAGPLRPSISIFNAGPGSAKNTADALFLDQASVASKKFKPVQAEIVDAQINTADEKISDDERDNPRNRRLASSARMLALSRPGSGSLNRKNNLDAKDSENVEDSWLGAAANKPETVKELSQRVSALEDQIADLRDLIGGKKTNESATIFENDRPALKANPDTNYQLNSKQYSSFIPNRQNVRSIADNV